MLAFAAPAAADGSTQADLGPLNVPDASGTAMIDVQGTTVNVKISASGLLPDAPHAQHIHFGEQATHECPTVATADSDGNGRVSTTEGAPFYGAIVTSLTATGDTSASDSALAVDRFPTAGPDGMVSYDRSFEVTQDVADAVMAGDAVVVLHGVDYNGNGEYDAEAGMSDLDPSLPAEATDPAVCGVLQASQMSGMPEGGVATGGGSTSGFENAGLLGAGALALVGGAAVAGRRRFAANR